MFILRILLLGIFGAFRIILRFLIIAVLLLSLLANFSLSAASTLGSITSALIGVTSLSSDLAKSLNESRSENKALKRRLSSIKPVLEAKSSKIIRRTKNVVSRNIAAIPAEAVPFAGVATVLTLTAWEIVESCKTIKDLNELRVNLGLEDSQDDATKFCKDAEREINNLKDIFG